MHMLTKPQKLYNETHKTSLGYQNPLYLSQAQRQQPALYNGNVLIGKHNPVSVSDSEETLILAEETEQLYWSSTPSPPETVSKPKVFPKKLLSTSQVLRNLNKARELLTKFDECIKRRTTLSPHEIGTKLYSITPFPKSKVIPKVVEKNDLSKPVTSYLTTKKIIEKCTKVLAPGLLKIKSEPINAYFKNNRVVHHDYLKVTKEHVATLHELLENARALKPLDEHIGRVSSTNASGSNPRSITKNDRIPQSSRKSMKNKVEAHHRKFKSSANKNNHVSACNGNVKNVALSKNFDSIYLSCNECLFSANHDTYVVPYLKKN
ncbi:hypothetical protein Tco_1254129 [Tanacetum coccineum]